MGNVVFPLVKALENYAAEGFAGRFSLIKLVILIFAKKFELNYC